MPSIESISKKIIACTACPRLRRHCEKIAREKKRAHATETYWGKPIPSFGDPKAQLFIMGLAPAAHGANRTGRMFTGDRSGDWLYRALHKAGFANQPTSTHRDDGLKLIGAYISAAAHCAPPDNKPLPHEIKRCSAYLDEELEALDRIRVFLVLGQIGLKALWPHLKQKGPLPQFKHGGRHMLADGRLLLMSYHPSQQNTFTGRLTEPQFDSVFTAARAFIG